MKPTPCYCGECSFLKAEDSCGFGYCEISDNVVVETNASSDSTE